MADPVETKAAEPTAPATEESKAAPATPAADADKKPADGNADGKADDKSADKAAAGPEDEKNAQLIAEAAKAHSDTFHHAEEGKLPACKKISYGAPMFSVTSLTMLIGIHGMMFYTKIGASTAFLAFFTALARSFDVVTDPLMGWISDRTRTKWGRRRPFMAVGCWGYAILFILLMSPPSGLGGTAVSLWFGFFYIIFYLFDTMSNVPHGALGPELSDDGHERNKIFFWANIFKALGILVAATGPVGLGMMMKKSTAECACDTKPGTDGYCPSVQGSTFVDGWMPSLYGNYTTDHYNKTYCQTNLHMVEIPGSTTQNATYPKIIAAGYPEIAAWCKCRKDCTATCDVAASRRAFLSIALFFGLFYIASIENCVFQLHERAGGITESPPIIPSLLATARNKPFMGLLPAWVCDMTSYTMIGTMLPFYLEYVVQPGKVDACKDGQRAFLGMDAPGKSEGAMWCATETWLGLGLVFLMGANIVSMPFWLWAAKKFGKYKAWMGYNLSTAITNGLFVFVGNGDPKLCVFMAFLNGLPAGAQFINDAMVADIIDYDEFLTGFRSEGRFTIFQTFIPKIVSVPSQAIPLALMSAFGFVSPINGVPQQQPDSVKYFIKVVFYVLPCLFALLSFFLKTSFPIKSSEITSKIVEGNAIHAAGHAAVDPLTGKTVKLFRLKNKDEEHYTWRLDNYTLAELHLMQDKGVDALIAKMKKQTVSMAISTVCFIAIVVVGIAVGLLSNKTLSFVPCFCVIGFGVSMALTLTCKVRTVTAEGMKANPIPDSFLKRWVQQREGTYDDTALNALPNTAVFRAFRHKRASKIAENNATLAKVADDGKVAAAGSPDSPVDAAPVVEAPPGTVPGASDAVSTAAVKPAVQEDWDHDAMMDDFVKDMVPAKELAKSSSDSNPKTKKKKAKKKKSGEESSSDKKKKRRKSVAK